MSSPPSEGRDAREAAPGLPMENGQGGENNRGTGEARLSASSRFVPTSGSKGSARRSHGANDAQQALDDAQKGLDSLLNPPADDKQPHIISASGAIRQTRHGRVAGPSLDADDGRRATDDSSETSTSLVPISRTPSSIVHRQSSGPTDRALQSLVFARSRAMMLVNPVDGETTLGTTGHEAHRTRRAAAQWATRYATHAIVLVVVGMLVAFGGLRSFTVANAGGHSLLSGNAFTGTDSIDDSQDAANSSQPDPDSPDYVITLPRTELGAPAIPSVAAPGSAGQTVAPDEGQAAQAQAAAQAAAKATDVNRYTVVAGDTIQSVADKFNVMPETVMGSNGIFDPDEELAPGRLLIVPPVDGMYYVVAKGDTLYSLANKFQVDPETISSYTANKIGDNGGLIEGTSLVVPGGMMPERQGVITYTVRKGDILKRIAARFGIDVPTMLNSNDIPDPDNLQPGMKLRVLPTQGMEYRVKKGDNILSIAARYDTTPEMILDYTPNHLTVDSVLQIDQVIILPGGSPPAQIIAERIAPKDQPSARGAERPPDQPKSQPVQPQPKPQPQPRPQPQPQAKQPQPSNSPKTGTGHLMWPVNGVITQYFTRSHNGLDIAISAGTPIHAADSGRVIWAGWRTDGLGYCVMIDHLNGLTTVYGHMIRQPSVYVGQYVARGQVIGNIGSTGHSTGPHVHFMVKAGSGASHDYRNPLAYLGR